MSENSETLNVPGYNVVQYLGSGARSTIWQVRDSRTGEVFALKRVIKEQDSDARFIEQALNEFNVSQNFDHDGIRKTVRVNRIKKWLSLRELHLFMEYFSGKTLQESRPGSLIRTLKIFHQVAESLSYINLQGFVHADMKPNNVLVNSSGHAKIIDLGQSCPIGTVKQRIQGTPDFIAPEQVHRRPLDAATDVYNFGATLYWTLTGQPIPTVLPKSPGIPNSSDLVITPPEEINPLVPLSLSKLVLHCTKLRPSDRPVSMEAVGSRLSLIEYTVTHPKPTPAPDED